MSEHKLTPYELASERFVVYGPTGELSMQWLQTVDDEGPDAAHIALVFDAGPETNEFIVRACNAHDTLATACKAVLRQGLPCQPNCESEHGGKCKCGAGKVKTLVRAALAKAKP